MPLSFTTRTDWRAAALKLAAAPVRAIAASPDQPLYWKGWPSTASVKARRLQGFMRGLSPLFALLPSEGEALTAPLGPNGEDAPFAPWLRSFLESAFTESTGPLLTTPERDMDQCIVEGSALAELLVVNREQLWDRLPAQVQTSFLDWFEACLNRFTLSINNWNLFALQIATALHHFGRPAPRSGVERLLRDVESMYKQGGWYADGYYRQFDQYVPAEIYPMLFFIAAHGDETMQQAASIWHQRAARFADDYQHFTDRDGRTVAYGRSLAYRLGPARFWASAALHHVPGIDPALCRDMLTRICEHVFSRPVFDAQGFLVPGYGYYQQALPELYIDAASLYSGMYVFVPLALPESDPFWQQERSVPNRSDGRTVELKAANSQLTTEPGGKNNTLLNGGIQHPFHFPQHPAKYGKFAYNSRFGFNLHLDGQWASDHALLVSLDGVSWTHPFHFEVGTTVNHWLHSRRRPCSGWEGVCTHTAMKQRGPWIVYFHTVVHTVPLWLRQGGTPLAVPWDVDAWSDTNIRREGGSGTNGSSAIGSLEGPWQPVNGFAQIGANILYDRTWIPALELQLPPGTHHLALASWQSSETGIAPDAWPALQSGQDDYRTLMWPDGVTEDVSLPSPDTSPLLLDSGRGKSFRF